jgi:hypothetical protein
VKRSLRLLAILIALGASVAWVMTGAHRGWTATRVTVIEVEAVTGLEHPVSHDRFVMGVELLGAGLALASSLWCASFFLNTKPHSNPHSS